MEGLHAGRVSRNGTLAQASGNIPHDCERHGRPREPGSKILTSSPFRRYAALVSGTAAILLAIPAAAQDESAETVRAPLRVRVALGPQVQPDYPGANEVQFAPLIDVAVARGDEPFEFEAPDESFGRAIIRTGGFSLGPAFSFEGSRKPEDVGTAVPKVDWTLELGAFAQYKFGDGFRLYSELRKGVNGHEGWAALGGADVIFRDRDEWLVSIGPRVTWTDDTYQDAFFSVAAADAGPSGLPAFDAGGGVQSFGAATSFVLQLSEQWGLYGYAKYDRLIGDPADSPIVRQHGSRDQLAGGLALTYTFTLEGLGWLD
jgi:outer membrane protein